MPTGIQIDSVLTLDTRSAEQQLKEIAKGVKPVTLPINFSSEAIEEKVAELKKVTFDWSVTPDIEFNAIAKLKEIVGEIQTSSQFKIIPDVGFVEINQLRQDIDNIRQLSTIDISTNVSFSQIERLKQDLNNLKNEFEFNLSVASRAANIPSLSQQNNTNNRNNINSSSILEDLLSNAKQQTINLKDVIEQQKNTQQTIKAESAVSISNFLKGKVASAVFGGVKNAVVSEFNIDEKGIEKAIKRILPTTRIIADDIKDFSQKIINTTGIKKNVDNLINSLLAGLADATAGAKGLEDLQSKLKKFTSESFSEFNNELSESIRKISDLQTVLKSLGLSRDQYLRTLIESRTGASTIRGISRTLDRPLAERKDRIQTQRLTNVLQRAEELIATPIKRTVKPFSKSESTGQDVPNVNQVSRQGKNVLKVLDDTIKELILVIGGFAYDPTTGRARAAQINQQLVDVNKFDTTRAVGLNNPDTYKGELPHAIASMAAVLRPNVRGFSRDAEEMAAQAIAAMIKNPQLNIKLVGESGGGLVVEEVVQILNKLGFGDRVQGAGFGTPSLKAKASTSENFNAFLGVNKEETLGYEVKEFYSKLGFVDPSVTRRNPKVSQDLKGLGGHAIDNYFKLDEFRSFVLDESDGKKQVRASAKNIAELRKQAIRLAIGGADSEVLKALDEFESKTRITGDALEPFKKLRQDIEAFQADIDKGIIADIRQYSEAISTAEENLEKARLGGDVNYIKDLQADIPKIKVIFKRLKLEASSITKEIILQLEKNIINLDSNVPDLTDPGLIKADYIGSRSQEVLDNISDIDSEQLEATFEEIETTLVAFLDAVKQLDNIKGRDEVISKLEAQLERVKTIKNTSNVVNTDIDSNIELLPEINEENIDKKTLKKTIAKYKDTIIAYRKEIEQKIFDGTVTDAELEAGKELVRRSQALSEELKEQGGFSREVKSLSGVTDTLNRKISTVDRTITEDVGKDVVEGILKGTNEKLAVVFAQGEALGIELLEGFKKKLEIKSPSGKFSDEMSDVAAGIVEGRKKQRARIRQAGEDIGQDLFDGSQLSLSEYKQLLSSLEGMIQNFDISDSSEEMKKLEKSIQETADKIAAFQEIADSHRIKVEPDHNSLHKYKELLFKLETSIQNFDISDTSEEMKKLERVIEDTADEIAAFLEVSNNGKLGNLGNNISDVAAGIVNRKLQERKPNIQAGDELDEFLRNIPDDINLDLEVDDKELNEFLRNIPDDIELEIETDTGNSNQQLSRLDRNLERVRRTATNTLRALVGFGVLRITSSLGNYFEDIIRQSIETQIRFEQLETSINFVAGSAEEGAKSLDFVRQTARKLKIDLEVATNGYKQLAAAANNTALETETNRIFSSVTQASRVFGLSAEQTEGAILALSQMISKGTVQAEELRGQLGERIPGSFQIAARAMGVTTQELGKLLETGQVTAEEFLPKFARQLASETKGGVTGAINTTGAAIQELRGAYTQLQLEIAETTKPAQLILYTTLADSIKLASENLNILIPAAKILTSTLIVLFLPAIVSLGNLLKGLILANFGKLLTLLNANIASLGAMAKTTKILSAAFKTFVIIEVLSQAIALTQNLTTINQEAKDAVKDLDEAYQEFVKNLSKNQPENKLLQEDIVEGNIKKAKDELGKGAKFLDAATDNFIGRSAKKGIANIPLLLPFRFDADRTFADAAIEDAEAKAIEAISKANANLSNISIDIGTDIEEIETDDLQNAVDAINSNIANLEVFAPTTIETLNGQREAIARQNDELKKYNDELKRRDGLEKTFAKVDVVRKKAVEDATRIESEALNKIDREILESGDLKRDVELEKLTATDNRITAELEAERQALKELQSIVQQRSLNKARDEIAKLQKQFDAGTISAKALADGTKGINDRLIGIDSDSGFLKGLSKKEIETFTKRRDRIVELEKNAVESKISIATEEVEQKIVEYDRYLEEIENRRQKAEDLTIESEKRRLIEIQQLINDDVISTEQAEELKANATYDRIKDELDEEKHKLYKLKRFKTDSVEAQEKADNDIKASRQKVLDLTLQLLQEEQQAEERTTNAIAQSRDNLFAKMEQRLSRIQQLYNLQSQLEGDRATSQEKLADLELSRLKQALAIRQQINNDDLDQYERQTALKQLYSLGIKGRTDEISLLNKIEDKEKAIAKAKMANLERQQELARANLEIENQRFELETRKAKLEADREQRQAEQKVLDADTAITEAEQAVANATTEEELEIANKQLESAYELYDIAQLSLDITNQEQIAANQQLDNLDNIIAKKRENLELSQAIARAEQEGISLDQLFERDKAFNQAMTAEDRRKAETLTDRKQDKLLNQYLTNQEKIDKETEKRVNKLIEQQKERLGDKFTSEDESVLREQQTSKIKASLTRQFNKQENREENKTIRSLSGSPGFSIEAPPEILNAIKNGKPFVVPVIPEVKSNVPLEVKTIGETKGSLDSSSLILNTLKNIEQNFKQPTVINVTNDNQFVNQYQRDNMDEILRRTRSDLVEVIKTVGNDLS